ncbi:MAG: Rrf2 family transcriptional regulator [Candidatus Marinimicrobia bacterium]|nr:Rrf2 family transcriptional regulator [Candidatus Neomarinimicrobiota bacterium]MCF7829980.1 Rrf2 family transcriptional regulator [Candidatus Neomarinimicrobiota bacterium]MCF7881866.1 Rrf2 family transcriptional regulator [Candidatus Neomarinimicrobiota bacterium]
MIEITKASEYSLRATAALVDFYKHDKTATVAEIAVGEAIPESFLRKLLKPLIRASIVRSERGYSGGITLAKSPKEITVLDVIEAVDGKLSLNDCVLDPSECGLISRCAIHGLWVETTDMITGHLSSYSLEDVQRKYLSEPTKSP